ncbi:MAG: hypothetical protein E6Q24_04915 [Chitinophagaceae bacterium]|nr:MAG: hypothetical protein E6Q24_04915 [Chitinophagaceae bacterium]
MIVYCNTAFEQESWEKNVIATDYLSGLIYHFQNLNFGPGVNEIVYLVVSGTSGFTFSYEEVLKFKKKTKTIESIFFCDYNIVREADRSKLIEYLEEQLLSESTKFKNLNTPDFQLDDYITSLKGYLLEAKKLMQQNINPAAGKKLNDDIQEAMAKKFLKL